ncbi:unnamed protein product [Mycena citricolor]|uniref:A-kinase anchor protein 7-like phosphoesterase domain-containing protein n=1 Tax=Mycena citricolor TaxID=2018698 RepID=A0AAD2HMB9_9AGAR|nr:unnamed protein product [Mycena citricolor]
MTPTFLPRSAASSFLSAKASLMAPSSASTPKQSNHASNVVRPIKTAPDDRVKPDRRRAQERPQSIRPTHFLSLPIGHHADLRTRVSHLHARIKAHAPPIVGIDPSILVDPRRLHFTLGVMTLVDADRAAPSGADEPTAPTKTVAEALALLRSLKTQVAEISAGGLLALPLDHMGVLKTHHEEAGVLYVAPKDEEEEETKKIRRIVDLVARRFQEEGFIHETRPVLLHCTLINASHRRPRRSPKWFSYQEVFALASPEGRTANINAEARSADVDLGAWTASEIQLCRMGSHGPENEYFSCGSILLS